MKKRIGIGRAHSKIILMGEHAVVYGYPAIALPLKNIEVECRIKSAGQPLAFDFYDPLSTAIYAALDYLGKINEDTIGYDIKSQVPQKRGMGSSAAVSIAAIRAVFDYYDQPLEDNCLEILVNQAEIIAHNNPSGLDAKTCLSDSAIKFIRNIGFTELELNLNAFLIIADTGIHGHTREAVVKVAQFEETNLPYLAHLGELTAAAEKHIAVKDLKGLGQDMTEAHGCLQKIAVSIRSADYLVQEALQAGALGAKLSGGGLGGCIIALAEDAGQAQHIEQKLKEKGALHTWIEKL
ncbi:mevalonate kinase [Streptococcus sp. H31]|uniref:mevalonate kinase n=1 Tax=Streptococcus huangxiaojuni TaxID=3237239 RepID=UPI0034A4B64E